MELAFYVVFAVVALFSFVLLFGAPYLPTLRRQSDVAFELLDLEKGQMLYELGCGDGRVLKQAAERGLSAVGYELNPLLAIVARIHTWRYRKQVRVVCGNFWKADLDKADGVFVFLLDRYMGKFDQKMKTRNGTKIKVVSYAFKIPGKKFIKQKSGMFLYKY